MKIFDKDGKTNFVDENNVLVGYSNYQCCCEDFGYLFTRKIPKNSDCSTAEWLGEEFYRFDPEFFQHSGDMVHFKLHHVDDVEDIVYLTLYNYHNGYYSHGFIFSVDGVVKQDEYI